MTTSIDTNIIAALWSVQDPSSARALELLNAAESEGELAICAPVYSEMMAGPLRQESAMDRFFADTNIRIEWELEESIWREAGRAYRSYADRRRSGDKTYPRRVLADFVIGAHALIRGYTLLTLDLRLYAAAFPTLKIVSD